VRALDAHTLLIPDAPGNNRLDTLENIIATGRIGVLFLIPGVDETLRVNGTAGLSCGADHLALFASVDSVGEQAEYIRHGLKFDTFSHNVNRYLSEVNANSVSFINTFNAMSVTGLPRFIDMVLELRAKHSHNFQRVWFDTPMLRDPKWQSIQLLPKRYQDLMEESIRYMRKYLETRETRFKGTKDFEVAKLERVLGWMREEIPNEELKRGRANFFHFFTEHDRRRGTNFTQTFPEMCDFWELCEKAAQEVKK
jgi:hypothetical protein